MPSEINFNKLFFTQTSNTKIQLLRYFFVGGIAAVFDLGSLYLLTEFYHLHYLISAGIAFLIGVIVNYILSKLWIFKEKKYKVSHEFILFVIIGIVGLFLNELIIWLIAEILNIWYLLAKIFAIGIVFFWNFLARKFLIFNLKKNV